MKKCISILILLTIMFNFPVRGTKAENLYDDLKYIEKLLYVTVIIQGEKLPEVGIKAGILDENDIKVIDGYYNSGHLTDYLKLRIKNDLGNVTIMNKDQIGEWIRLETLTNEEKMKVGTLSVRIWIVGDSYPVAYHIKAEFGNVLTNIWWTEYLGYCSCTDLKTVARNTISEIVEKIALIYFKVRDEI